MAEFIGREAEVAMLQSLWDKNSASFIVVRGRRRIGKSRLIREFAKKYKFYKFEGLAPTKETTKQMQLDTFSKQLASQTSLPEVQVDDWVKLFQFLWDKTKEGKVVVLLDEISWMGSKDPEFLSKIKMAWDNYFSHNKQLILIICGSASSWIEQNILSATGFVGRISQIITLEELPLNQLHKFWNNKNISKHEILKVVSVTGGVPKYLEEINPKITAEENIMNLCFTRGGFLAEEFDRIFSDLFLRASDVYRKIVQVLVVGDKTNEEIADSIDFSKSARLTEYLHELTLAGFLERHHAWNFKTKKDTKIFTYRLKDNYLRFYLKYIYPNKNQIDRGSFDLKNLTALPAWQTIAGLQFENLVLNNRKQIWQELKLEPSNILNDNPYLQRKTKTQDGCQIDYLIQDRFNSLYLCEIKFSNSPIGMDIVKQIEKKIQTLKSPKNMSYRPVLIAINGVTEEVEHSPFFYKIIDFANLV